MTLPASDDYAAGAMLVGSDSGSRSSTGAVSSSGLALVSTPSTHSATSAITIRTENMAVTAFSPPKSNAQTMGKGVATMPMRAQVKATPAPRARYSVANSSGM